MRVTARMLAGTLAVLCAILPAVVSLHGSLQEHHYCAEHSRLEHADGARGDSSMTVGGAAADSVAQLRGTAGQDSAVHEVCALTAAVNSPAASARRVAAVATSIPFVQVAQVPARAAPPAPVAILAFAPKSSPPSLAV